MKQLVAIVLVLLLILNFVGLYIGGATAAIMGHCEYNRLISYVPGHIIACELFRVRESPHG